jgi:hypothetical protein
MEYPVTIRTAKFSDMLHWSVSGYVVGDGMVTISGQSKTNEKAVEMVGHALMIIINQCEITAEGEKT